MKLILQQLEMSKLRNLILRPGRWICKENKRCLVSDSCRKRPSIWKPRARVSKTNAKLNKFPQIIKKAWPRFFKSRSSFFYRKTESARKRFIWICLSSFFFVKSSQSCGFSPIVRKDRDCVPILAISWEIVIFYDLFRIFTNWRNVPLQNT